MKLAWQVPRQTHTYFVDHLLSCDHTSVKVDIMSRFVKFVMGLRASPSVEVAVLCGVVAGDVRTVTGSNLNMLFWETGLSPLGCSVGKVKTALSMRLAPIPKIENWRVAYLGKLPKARGEAFYLGEETGQVTALIDCLCVN